MSRPRSTESADPSATVNTIVSNLTLDQKVAQLTGMHVTDLFAAPTTADEQFGLDTARLAVIRPHGVGHLSMAWFLGTTRESMRSGLELIQAGVREVTPFGIGAVVHIEGISGFLHDSGSQFPTSWAQATTWDPTLVRRAAAVTAAHMRDTGVHLALSPVMDLARDPRWGRVHETYGEDVELVSQFSVAFVEGLQADAGAEPVLATGKHFAGYGASEGGLNQAVSQLGRRTITDEYAEPFRRAIAEAGLTVVMDSYNEIDGVPSVADRWLLTELLRGQLGFRGMVVSDYDAVNMLRTIYRTAATEGEAACQAVTAGLDVELPSNNNFVHLSNEVMAGRLDEQAIDTAVARVLTIKERVGLIPNLRKPNRMPAPPPDRAKAAAVRREIAEHALVLLENDGTLPLRPGVGKIVVVGPAADELRIHFGAYTSVSNSEMQLGARALLAGEIPGIDLETFNFTDIFQARMPGIEPRFEATTRALHPDAHTLVEALRNIDPSVSYAPLGRFESDTEQALATSAVAAAVTDADVIIAAVGERTGWIGNNTAGEGQSTAVPALPGDQKELIRALASTGKKLITIIVSGRPLLIEPVSRASNAVLLAPLLGEEAGDAIARAIFGRVNPSGKLPSTFPRSSGQIPIYHGHRYGSGYDHPTGTRHGYGDLEDQSPLYAFGHGLSYSTFTVQLDPGHALAAEVVHDAIVARLIVSNSAAVNGETVVQLYARDEGASIVRPVRQLIAFARVALASGQSRPVELRAPLDRLRYTLPSGQRGLEAGEVTLTAGLSSDEVHCTVVVDVPEYLG